MMVAKASLSSHNRPHQEREGAQSWTSQCARWRESLGLPSDTKLWSADMAARGMSNTPRIRKILDLVAAQKLKPIGFRKVLNMSHADKQKLLRGTFCDVSQNPKFASFTNESGNTGCLATSTTLYSFGRDRVVLPIELALFQGHRRGILFPPEIKSSQIRSLAGEGMSLPCLGSVVWCMYLLKGLP